MHYSNRNSIRTGNISIEPRVDIPGDLRQAPPESAGGAVHSVLLPVWSVPLVGPHAALSAGLHCAASDPPDSPAVPGKRMTQ
jgi:hypothetical protein